MIGRAMAENARSLVDRLYQGFNDSGFLGMGGTDEEAALEALKIARDMGLMKELDDELS